MDIHVVRAGETLNDIARAYGVGPGLLSIWNGLSQPDRLAPGQALLVLEPRQLYQVQAGDTLYAISRRFNLSLEQLYRNNIQLAGEPLLYPGQTLALSFVEQEQPRRSLWVSGYAYTRIEPDLLRTALPYLTALLVFTYGFSGSGDLIPEEDGGPLALARVGGSQSFMVLAPLDQEGAFNNELITQLFAEPGRSSRLIGQILTVALRRGYAGVMLDLEYVPAGLAADYAAFAAELGQALREQGLELDVALAPKTFREQRGLLYEGHDYAALGAAANRVMLMTYEWGYTYGPPMAVAPLNEVRRVAEYALSEIPASQLVLGIPNYGYDWTLPYEQGRAARSIGHQEAIDLAIEQGANISYDETVQAPWFSYTEDGVEHIVWFEDIRSIQAKLDLADELGLAGVSYWTLMRPFNANWMLLNARYDILRDQ